MGSRIPVQRLYRATVVVNDLRTTARNYARIFGITRWDVHHWTAERLRLVQAYGYQTQFGYSAASGTTANGITFRLVQPIRGFSTFTEYLITRGEGIHSLCVARLDAADAEMLRPDVPLAQSVSYASGGSSLLFDTRASLGGFFVEIEIARDSDPPPDETWDLSSEGRRPDGVSWLTQIPKIGHFGVAVASVIGRLPAYASLLGIERWTASHFHGPPGPLEDATLDGHAVDNAWLLAITDVADFGLELLQGTHGPTDYRRTVESIGEGIHHVLVRRGLSEVEWVGLQAWMESMNIGIVMSGRLGAAQFAYFDTRSALGGYLLEVIVSRDGATAPAAAGPAWRFSLDFSTKA